MLHLTVSALIGLWYGHVSTQRMWWWIETESMTHKLCSNHTDSSLIQQGYSRPQLNAIGWHHPAGFLETEFTFLLSLTVQCRTTVFSSGGNIASKPTSEKVEIKGSSLPFLTRKPFMSSLFLHSKSHFCVCSRLRFWIWTRNCIFWNGHSRS